MTITVTAAHCAAGKRSNHFRNPLALALQEVDEHAMVTSDRAHTVSRIYAISYEAREWLRHWNATGVGSPRTFFLI